MTNTLKSQLSYLAVAAGGQATLPHHIQLNDTNIQPDHIDIENPSFDYVSSTTTTVTMINNSLAPASCRILCELWHTIERVFGDGSQNLPAKPFISRGSSGGGGSASTAQVFTYVCTGAEGSDFNITLPAARMDDNYVPQVTCGGVTQVMAFDLPDLLAGDRTTTQFRVITSVAVTAADRLDVTVQERT